jgi:uncharacterized protein (UPF0333 family)
MNKRGQVTVFIILGIVILVAVFLVFYFLGDNIKRQSEVNVVFDESSLEPLKNYVEDCIESKGNEAIDLVLKNGGMINPGLYYTYNENKVNYLCYTDNFEPCINKHPFVDKMIENEITNYLNSNIQGCIDLNEIRNEGYEISEGQVSLNVDLTSYNMIVDVYYPITISKAGTEVTESRFSHSFNVPLGKFAEVAEDVVKEEILYGTSFNQIYETLHDEVTIIPFSVGDTKIYTIKERGYDSEFIFAVRGWVA